jgi:hypothetical protein
MSGRGNAGQGGAGVSAAPPVTGGTSGSGNTEGGAAGTP